MDKGKNTLGESSGSKLNPYAKPFRPPANVQRFERILIERRPPASVPRLERIPIDRDRTLFMTFSTDFPPISQHEIDDYFTRRFGTCCIESLYVHGRNEGDSELGIITFSTILVPYDIMRLREEVVLFICSRPVHFKRFLGGSGVA